MTSHLTFNPSFFVNGEKSRLAESAIERIALLRESLLFCRERNKREGHFFNGKKSNSAMRE